MVKKIKQSLTRKQLMRCAEILDRIQVLGDELNTIIDLDEAIDLKTPVGVVRQFASETLGLDPDVFITPGMMADQLRKSAST